MTRPSSPPSMAGPLLLLVIILADVGLVVWGWHLREQRKAADYGSSGLNLASAPPPQRRAPVSSAGAPARASAAPAAEALPSVVPEAVDKPSAAKAAAKADPLLKNAEEAYYALKNSPRFRNSKVLQEWKRDFLAYPDLAALEAAYRKDRDAGRFIRGMVRSPNFRKMLVKYAPRPDLQAFLKAMAGKQSVTAAAGLFYEDNAVMGVFKSLRLPGGAPVQAPPPRRLEFKRSIDEEAVSPEALRRAETGRPR